MDVLVWINEATWPACVAAARELAPADARVTLLAVTDDDVAAAARGALAGLFGRAGAPSGAAEARMRLLATEAATELLAAAVESIGREVTAVQRHGRVEREVVAAAAGADLLVRARDGDLSRLGPHSLAPATRFVLDHAPCSTLLVWPVPPPDVGSIPPPPPPGAPRPSPGTPPPHPPHHRP